MNKYIVKFELNGKLIKLRISAADRDTVSQAIVGDLGTATDLIKIISIKEVK